MESKADFKRRLQEAGLWDEAVQRREFLKGTGTPIAEAWEQVRREYPEGCTAHVIGTEAADDPDEEDLPDADIVQAKKWSLRADVQWVYQNLDKNEATVDRASCPGPGAMAQWRWAVQPKNTPEWFRGLFVRVFGEKSKDDEHTEKLHDDGGTLSLADELIAHVARHPLPPRFLLPAEQQGGGDG